MSGVLDDWVVGGNLSSKTFSAPVSCISDTAVATPSAGAAGINTTKNNHRQHARYAQPNTTAVTETRPIWITYGTSGTLVKFRAGSIVANIGAATVTVDLWKNGSSILSAPITLNSSDTARTPVDVGSFTSTTTAAGDWFDAVITATAGGGTLATGVYAELIVDENPS